MTRDLNAHGLREGILILTSGHHDLLSLLLLALIVHHLSMAVVDDDEGVLLPGLHVVWQQDHRQDDGKEAHGETGDHDAGIHVLLSRRNLFLLILFHVSLSCGCVMRTK